jgi:hypothetical protein
MHIRVRSFHSRPGMTAEEAAGVASSLLARDDGPAMAFSSEVDTPSREENASKQKIRASVLIQSEPKKALKAQPSEPQLRVRIRIMKLSKLSSATCIHIRESLRYAVRLAYILAKCGLLLESSA